MNKHEFKVGDKVYCPMLGTGVYIVTNYPASDSYPVDVGGELFTREGLFAMRHDLPSVYRATKENHHLLSELHGVEFEQPELTGSERVRQLLKENPNRAVLCGVSDVSEAVAKTRPARVITHTREDGKFITDGGGAWMHAVPIDESELKPQELYTGK